MHVPLSWPGWAMGLWLSRETDLTELQPKALHCPARPRGLWLQVCAAGLPIRFPLMGFKFADCWPTSLDFCPGEGVTPVPPMAASDPACHLFLRPVLVPCIHQMDVLC